MKKRIIAISLMVLMMLFALSACGSATTQKYKYSHSYVANYGYDGEYNLDETFEFIYSDTYLKINDDGTWSIDTPLFLFINMDIDKGTYEVDSSGRYRFYGFEYGMTAYGERSGDQFTIRFITPGSKNETMMAIYYTR